MNRYQVPVFIIVDAETDTEAENLVTSMMCGTETMSRMWQVEKAEFKWRHEE